MIKKTKYFSFNNGKLPKGCQMCVNGRKLVLFVTGICSRKCFYCSISDNKYMHDVIYANEREVKRDSDIIAEAIANQSHGAGFTGGDPLLKLKRTLRYIRLLKKNFGKKFHIHMYTLPERLSEKILKRLYEAGLDEIRLHPNLEDKTHWDKIKLLKNFKWDFGLEIPAIPHLYKNTIELLKYANGYIKFLNINELEIADNSQNSLNRRGYFTKDGLSYGIKNSEKTALNILKYCDKEFSFCLHYCTAKLKDKVQLRERIKHRAIKIANKFDRITPDGILERYAIYLPETKPGIKFNKKEEARLSRKLKVMLKGTKIKDYILDRKKIRALAGRVEIKKHSKSLILAGLIPTLVFEYPTQDKFIVELQFLK